MQKNVQYRVQGLAEVARKANLPFGTSKKIKQYIENNVASLFNQDDDAQMIKMLPPYLRDEILKLTYGEVVGTINFFYEVGDDDFLWEILPML